MILPELTFRHLGHSAALEAAARRHAEKLEHFHGRISKCTVAFERAHGRGDRRGGAQYEVRVSVTVPGAEIVATEEVAIRQGPYVALHHAFHRVRRELEDHVRRRRGFVKTHERRSAERARARVQRIEPRRGVGVLETAAGLEFVFYRAAVEGDGFDELTPGTEVTFVPAEADSGQPSATLVAVRT